MGYPLIILAVAQGLVIDTPSPDALCPDLARTRETVHARLGEVGEGDYRAVYTIVHERGDNPKDFVRLELFDASGAVRLQRALPIGRSCSAVADAIALVLERYFRTLIDEERGDIPDEADREQVDEPAPPEPQPRPDAVSEPPADAAPVATSGSVQATVRPAEAPRAAVLPAPITRDDTASAALRSQPSAEFALSLQGLIHSFAPGPAVALRFEHHVVEHWGLSWGAAVPLGYREQIGGEDWVRSGGVDLRAALTWSAPLGALRPFVGVGAFVLAERESFGGPGYASAQLRASLGPSIEVGWRFSIGEGFFLNIQATGGWNVWATAESHFQEQGRRTPEQVLAYAGLGAGRAFSF